MCHKNIFSVRIQGTTAVLLKVTNDLLLAEERVEFLVLSDLGAAFDTAAHASLIDLSLGFVSNFLDRTL